MTKTQLRLDDFIPYRLSFTSNLVSDAISSAYEALFGLKIPEWRLIAVIAEDSGLTQQEIGVRTRMEKITVSRAAIALADRGLIERAPSAADRRARSLVLTPLGRKLYAEVAPKALELEAQIFGGFEAEELTRFVDMLRRIDTVTLQAKIGHQP